MAVWSSGEPLHPNVGGDLDIHVARSTDGGATWTAPAPLNSRAAFDDGEARDSDVDLETDRAGTWVAVWRSRDDHGGTIGTDYDILSARSTDGGRTWTESSVLNSNAASDSASDYRPKVATNRAGTWVTVWESEDPLGDTIGTDYDVIVARSMDAGATWTAVQAINNNATWDWGSMETHGRHRHGG